MRSVAKTQTRFSLVLTSSHSDLTLLCPTHSSIHTRNMVNFAKLHTRMIHTYDSKSNIQYAYHMRLIRSTVSAFTHSMVPTCTVYDVACIFSICLFAAFTVRASCPYLFWF